MKILWLTWKDLKNPQSGGAESLNENIAKRLVISGHEVIFLVAGFENCKKVEIINGYKVVRVGNKWTVYWMAYLHYKKSLNGWANLVIDEINTLPFFAKFYVSEKNILFIPQLCRIIWFYEMFFPLNLIGYLLEPLYLWLLSDKKVITISQSTKNDLIKFGFKVNSIQIITELLEIKPLNNLSLSNKFQNPTILSLGSIRKMKRTIDIIKGFELAREKIADLKLMIAGDSSSSYGKKVLHFINTSRFKKDIEYYGKVNMQKKIELMQKSHLIAVTSIKEGWGLIITEANSQGTPAIVYNVDGLRDSVKNNETGLICQRNNPDNLSQNVVSLLRDKTRYEKMRKNSWEYSKEIIFGENSREFLEIIETQ